MVKIKIINIKLKLKYLNLGIENRSMTCSRIGLLLLSPFATNDVEKVPLGKVSCSSLIVNVCVYSVTYCKKTLFYKICFSTLCNKYL